MVKVNRKQQERIVCIDEMKCGQIGEIVEWDGVTRYLGRIVQRYENGLVTIGENWGSSFPTSISGNCSNFKVRLLEEGDEIIIVKN